MALPLGEVFALTDLAGAFALMMKLEGWASAPASGG